MSFAVPWMLGALLALGFPIAAHLLGRKRERVVQFSAIRFLQPAPPTQSRQRTLQDRGLFLIRFLLWLFLALALARPQCERQADFAVLQVPQDALVVLDANARTHHLIGSKSLWHHEIDRARELIKALPGGSRVGLATLGRPIAGIPIHTDTRRALALLDAWESDDGERGPIREASIPLSQKIAGLVGQFESTEAERPRVLYLIAEPGPRGLQEAGLSQFENIQIQPIPAWSEAPTPAQVQLGIERVQLSPASELGSEAVRIHAVVRDYAEQIQPGASVLVELIVDGKKAAEQRVEFVDSTSANVHLVYGIVDGQSQTATLRLADHRDTFPLDDAAYFWLSSPRPLRVDIVNGDPSEQRAHDEVYLFATALRSAFPGDLVAIRGIAPEQLFEGLEQNDATLLQDTDVLVLANVAAPSTAAADVLKTHVEAGMGLWMAVGSRVSATPYNQAFGELLPLLLREAVYSGTTPGADNKKQATMAAPSMNHPIFAQRTTQIDLRGAQTQRLFLLEPDPTRTSNTALAFSHGAPALITKEFGKGRVALLTTSIDRDWTDLALRPGFVPLIDHTLTWLGQPRRGAFDAEHRLMRVGAPIDIPGGDTFTVDGPQGLHEVLEADTEARQFLGTDRVGHYVARPVTSATETPDPSHALRFAVNLDPRESAPPQSKPIDLDEAEDGDGNTTRATQLIGIWPPLLGAAALLLLLESILRQRRNRKAL